MNRNKQNQDKDILDPQLREKLEQSGGFDESNQLVILNKRKRKRKNKSQEENEHNTHAIKPHKRRRIVSEKEQSKKTKAREKRIAKLIEKVEKEKQRAQILSFLQKNQLNEAEMKYFHSSRTLGQTETKKQKLRRALLEEKAGIPRSDPAVRLYVTKEIQTNVSQLPLEPQTPPDSFFTAVSSVTDENTKTQSSNKQQKKKIKVRTQKKNFFGFDDENDLSASESENTTSDEEETTYQLNQSTETKKTNEIISHSDNKNVVNKESDENTKKEDGSEKKTNNVWIFPEHLSLNTIVKNDQTSAQQNEEKEDNSAENNTNSEGTNLKNSESGDNSEDEDSNSEVSKEKPNETEEKATNREKNVGGNEMNNEMEGERVNVSFDSEGSDEDDDSKLPQNTLQEIEAQVLKASLLPGEDTLPPTVISSLASNQTSNTQLTTTPSKFFVQLERKPEVEEQRSQLPIIMEEQPIMEAVTNNDVVIICGETGSGKTTQVPQFLYEAGFSSPQTDKKGMIGITEPRRVAAVSMAKRVAYEMNLPGPDDENPVVSYQIRYDSAVSPSTRIKFMTDGILLREIQSDFLLNKYSAIIIDEAHERSMNTDILLGLLSRIVPLRREVYNEQHPHDNQQQKRKKKSRKKKNAPIKTKVECPLKLIIMSATLRIEDFTQNQRMFRVPPPVIKIESRQYPVTIHFNKKTPQTDYVTEAYRKVCKIHERLPEGGILVFLTGQQEIEQLCKMLRQQYARKKAFLLSSKDNLNKWSTNSKSEAKATSDDAETKKENSDDEEEQTYLLEKNALEDPQVELPVTNSNINACDSVNTMNGETKSSLDSTSSNLLKEILPSKLLNYSKTQSKKESVAIVTSPSKVVILPLYSMLSPHQQLRVFETVPSDTRLIVVATNVAETSITIPGIKYVVDCGRVKQKIYDKVNGISHYEIVWTSQASANQRAGRAGRVGPGHCYRLYSSVVFHDHFPKFSPPEILNIPIEAVVLQMKSMAINKIESFPFPTPPDPLAIKSALNTLVNIGALNNNEHKTITTLGKTLAVFPIMPRFAKMLLLSRQSNCLPYIVAIVSALSVGDPFLHIPDDETEEIEDEETHNSFSENTLTNKIESQKTSPQSQNKKSKSASQLEERRKEWANQTSDLLAYLNAIGAYEYAGRTEDFCQKYGLHVKTMKEIHQLRQQLAHILSLYEKEIFQSEVQKTNIEFSDTLEPPTPQQKVLIRQIIAAGFVDRVAKRVPELTLDGKERKNKWKYVLCNSNQSCYIHPSSCLASVNPEYVVYHEIIETKKVYLKGVTAIHPSWLVELASPLCTFSKPLENPSPRYDLKKDKLMCFVIPYYGVNKWELPIHEVEYPAEEGVIKYKWFARLFLEGAICPKMTQFQPHLVAKPSLITTQWAQQKIAAIIQPFLDHNIDTKEKLVQRWKKDPQFLLNAVALWIEEAKHRQLRDIWPPLD